LYEYLIATKCILGSLDGIIEILSDFGQMQDFPNGHDHNAKA